LGVMVSRGDGLGLLVSLLVGLLVRNRVGGGG
jgi:hypothetical protein